MNKTNSVFIATSIDGYISDKNDELDWLHYIPNPDSIDMGYGKFTNRIDAIVMGRTTFETVCGFDIAWPYKKPLFVLSNTLLELPESYKTKAELVKGSLTEILEQIHKKGYHRLYIDGGTTIQSFLNEDLIDELVITTIPILLGGGSRLFAELTHELKFEHVESKEFLNDIVQSHYKRIR